MPVPRPEPREWSSAERTALYKSLSSPLRRQILDHLRRHREANSTTLARELGESTGTTSYHLRKLAELGLIEEVGERPNGRERWWRSLPFDFQMPSPAEMQPEERAAAEILVRQRAEYDMDLYRRVIREYDGPDGWVQASRGGALMTKDDVHAFYREYLDLIYKYGHERDAAPAGARPVALRFFAVPEEPLEDPPEPDA